MENASKALLIAGAILLVILIIAIGMFIYQAANEQLTDAVTGMSRNQVNAFNSTFLNYEGTRTGAQVKSLLQELISNANTYADEQSKLPYVYCQQISTKTTSDCTITANDDGVQKEYIDGLGTLRNRVDQKHEYYIEMNYQENGLVDYVLISFDADDTANYLDPADYHR